MSIPSPVVSVFFHALIAVCSTWLGWTLGVRFRDREQSHAWEIADQIHEEIGWLRDSGSQEDEAFCPKIRASVKRLSLRMDYLRRRHPDLYEAVDRHWDAYSHTGATIDADLLSGQRREHFTEALHAMAVAIRQKAA